ANYLIWWNNEHPVHEDLRGVLSLPYIEPAPPGDPQPNPPDQPEGIYLIDHKYDSNKEIHAIVQSLRKWLPNNQDKTVAVLVPRNERGAKVVEALRQNGIEVVELLQSTQSTRTIAEILCNVLRVLSDPLSPRLLEELYQTLRSREAKRLDFTDTYNKVKSLLQHCERVEDYLAPTPERNWLEQQKKQGNPDEVISELVWLQQSIRRWQAAALLPIDQLILTVAQDLFTAHNDLALAHKLALVLEHARMINPLGQLNDFITELDSIVKRQRKIIGFSDDDTGFDPDQHKGKVVVATIHKAKGLEWDRVYLMSVNNYDFPSAQPYDNYYAEKYFIRDELNLEAEALFRLRALLQDDLPGIFIEDGYATQRARVDYSAERLRLFYVGITRARSELVVTWNTGQHESNQPALPLVVLRSFWEQQNVSSS
ncbi:MAG: 3'-5' exonuclease, partial [Anaerolineales bacterium]